MSLEIHLLGRPHIESDGEEAYRFRSRKSWGVLAYLLLSDRRPGRPELASLLFGEAADPLRALRWCLSEIRRSLGSGSVLEGDPIALELAGDTLVDVAELVAGGWREAVALPGVGRELLEGVAFPDSPVFEAWLLAQRRHLASATEAILHEAALSCLSAHEYPAAIDHAVQVVTMNPYDENHQALLIRSYAAAGDEEAAREQLARCTDLYARELGIEPGPSVRAAVRSVPPPAPPADVAAIEAILESGAAALAAGAVEAGVEMLRSGVAGADRDGSPHLRAKARLALAEALIHSVRGEDEEGGSILHDVDRLATEAGNEAAAARASVELGYVDFLRGRYERAEQWLLRALALGGDSSSLGAKATTYLGSVASDRADYAAAAALLDQAVATARSVGDRRTEAYATTMLGRLQFLCGRSDVATEALDRAIAITEEDRWFAFLPWPQSFRAEVEIVRGRTGAADEILRTAFARACHLGDPCWEGATARGLALVAASRGDDEEAERLLDDARRRCNRLSDTYRWLDAYILDARCRLGVERGDQGVRGWIEAMHSLASRTGMREMIVRSLLHRAHATGNEEDRVLAGILAAEIDNPALTRLVDSGFS